MTEHLWTERARATEDCPTCQGVGHVPCLDCGATGRRDQTEGHQDSQPVPTDGDSDSRAGSWPVMASVVDDLVKRVEALTAAHVRIAELVGQIALLRVQLGNLAAHLEQRIEALETTEDQANEDDGESEEKP